MWTINTDCCSARCAWCTTSSFRPDTNCHNHHHHRKYHLHLWSGIFIFWRSAFSYPHQVRLYLTGSGDHGDILVWKQPLRAHQPQQTHVGTIRGSASLRGRCRFSYRHRSVSVWPISLLRLVQKLETQHVKIHRYKIFTVNENFYLKSDKGLVILLLIDCSFDCSYCSI